MKHLLSGTRLDQAGDMQAALSFLLSQSTHIEAEVYQTVYPDLEYDQLVPVDTSAPEWVQSITYFASDSQGKADWLARGADDMPTVNQTQRAFQTQVETAGIGYRYDLFEIQQALAMGVNLTSDRAATAHRISNEMIDRVALLGDASRNLIGLFNQPSVTIMQPEAVSVATSSGTRQSTAFADKTGQQQLKDINALITAAPLGSQMIEMCDTLVLPYTQLISMGQTFLSDENPTTNGTVLEYIQKNNIYTTLRQRPLTIRGSLHLDKAGEGGTSRAVAYRRAPDVLKMYQPMPFRFFPVWQDGPVRFLVPGAFRLGGVDVRRPGAFRYMDGV